MSDQRGRRYQCRHDGEDHDRLYQRLRQHHGRADAVFGKQGYGVAQRWEHHRWP
jgi:hypothetical protein